MPPDRIQSIVPMFGGGTRYVETLDAIVEFVESHHPTTDELVGWHRGSFVNVSSRESILRRARYLRHIDFLDQREGHWRLGEAGREYAAEQDTATLLRIMCERNVGLRSLLYALAAGPMTIDEVSEQQLNTHPELGWSPEQTDMAKQRVNWLRSLGVVEKQGDAYALTGEGRQFVGGAVANWAGAEWTAPESDAGVTAGMYETTMHARAVDPEFRATVLWRHGQECPISGVDDPRLLDVAHVLSWSEYPDYRADLTNVVPLSKTHHAAFDRELFTVDREYRLRVNPAFESESELLQRTIVDRAGERVPSLEEHLESAYLEKHNASLAWV